MESKWRVQQTELEETARELPLLGELSGARLLITGATGLLGTQLAKTALCYNRLFGGEIRVIACGRDREKLACVYDGLPVEQLVWDVRRPAETDVAVDYIIHCASATASRFFVEKPVDTIETAVIGTENMLNFAREKRVKGFLYTSSLEVYGIPPKRDVGEGDLGFIDPLAVRSSYSEGKRMAECLCASFHAQFGVPAVVARLTQTIGSGISYADNRVFAQFAKCVIEKKDIVLHTAGRTVRSYCDITDAVRALFTILLRGTPGQAYNVANPATAVSIADLAHLVCEENPEAGVRVVFQIPSDPSGLGYNPEMQISLRTDKLEELGWQSRVGLPEMFRKLIEGLREKREAGEGESGAAAPEQGKRKI